MAAAGFLRRAWVWMHWGGGVGVVVVPRSGLLGHCQGRAGGRLAMEALRRSPGSCLRRNDGGGVGGW